MFSRPFTSGIFCTHVHLMITTAFSKCSTIKSIYRSTASDKTPPTETKSVVPAPTKSQSLHSPARAGIPLHSGVIDRENSSMTILMKPRSSPSHLYPRPCRQLDMTLTKSSRRKGRLSSHPQSPPSPSAKTPSPIPLLLLLLVSSIIVRVVERE